MPQLHEETKAEVESRSQYDIKLDKGLQDSCDEALQLAMATQTDGVCAAALEGEPHRAVRFYSCIDLFRVSRMEP